MIDKSYVSIEQAVCPVCGITHDTGDILLHTRLRPVLESKTVTGWKLCPEHEKLHTDGYVALVECDTSKGGKTLNTVWRTGQIAHVRRTVFSQIFSDTTLDPTLPLVFVEIGVIARLQTIPVAEDEPS